MVDLIYPLEEQAPVLPGVSATNTGVAGRGREEMFPVITEDGLVIGQASRSYCHSGSRLLHPVVHLHLIDRQRRIYIQKRSMRKDLLPGKWDTAVGGHIRYGETIMEALYREAFEELGIRNYNSLYIESYRWDTERDAEFVNVFAAVGNPNPQPDHDEVDEGRWWPVSEIEEALDRDVFTPNFITEYQRINSRLLALL